MSQASEPKVIEGIFDGLVSFLDTAAQSDGLVRYRRPYELANEKREGRLDRIQSLVGSCFFKKSVVDHRLRLSKSHGQRIDAALSKDATGKPLIQFNLAKLLCLPAVAPAAELAELSGLFKRVQQKAEEHPEAPVHVTFLNSKDSTGAPCCEVRSFLGEPLKEAAQAFDQELQDHIFSSPVLAHFFRELAISLRRMGPYSQQSVSADVLFPDWPGSPHMRQ